ncbi:MAG TPA: hypothetical protein VJO34_16160 [Methylomirabilota bacterium]|nr:hypothetical protein [Methylomirabilota bacterium]
MNGQRASINRPPMAFLVLSILVLLISLHGADAHDRPGTRPPTTPLIYPGEPVQTAVLSRAGGHFHSLFVTPHLAAIFAGTHLGFFASQDRGQTWELVAPRFIREEVQGIAGGHNSRVLYVVTRGMGLQVSRDAGVTWTGRPIEMAGRNLRAVALDPRDPESLYVWAVGHGLFRSADGGEHWVQLAEARTLPPVESLAVHPDHPETLYAGTVKGVWRRNDGGYHWRFPVRGPRQRVTALTFAPGRANHLLAATPKGMFAVNLDGMHWERFPASPWGPPTGFAFSADQPGQLFVVTHEGVVATWSLDNGVWALATAPPLP